MSQFNNWVVAPGGDPINLQFFSQVSWGGNIAGIDPKTIYLFGTSGPPRVLSFPDVAAAQTAAAKLVTLLVGGGATDLRPVPAAGASQLNNPNTVPIAFTGFTAVPHGSDGNTAHANINGSAIIVLGTGFSPSQKGSLANTSIGTVGVTYLSSTVMELINAIAAPAGTYAFDYRYTDAVGNPQIMAAAVSIVFS